MRYELGLEKDVISLTFNFVAKTLTRLTGNAFTMQSYVECFTVYAYQSHSVCSDNEKSGICNDRSG